MRICMNNVVKFLSTLSFLWVGCGWTESVDLYTIQQDDVVEVARLLDVGEVYINEKDSFGKTALQRAVEHNSPKIVKLLLERGANAGVRVGYDKETLLHKAVLHNNTEIAELLIADGLDVHKTKDNGETSLHDAARQKNIAMMTLLMRHGLKVNAKNNRGETPLHIAAFYRDEATIDYLYKHGADVEARDNTGQSPLYELLAWGDGNIKFVELMVDTYGANIHVKDKDGKTPLDVAVGRKCWKIANYLEHQILQNKIETRAKADRIIGHCADSMDLFA